jgi:hypothetical protein
MPHSKDIDFFQDIFDAQLSRKLLSSSGLLTPFLEATFGQIRALSKRSKNNGGVYRRWSSVHQQETGLLLLDAQIDLVISRRTEPLTWDFEKTTLPMGTLLIRHNIDVNVRERMMFCSPIDGERYGRVSIFRCAKQDSIIAQVTEVLACEADLYTAHLAHLEPTKRMSPCMTAS